ncbi:hypothetical protein GCM10025331_72900 [Actinoplanes utahensis]|nr:hypothetical protein Aut01nite_68010 [Actinoplanes utahensis]
MAAVVLAVTGCARVDAAPGPAPAAPSASPAADMARLIVRDGDLVEASGTVLAAPGGPVRFCAPAPTTAIGGGPPVPDCSVGVPVLGVDLNRLAEAGRYEKTRFGRARLRGEWRSGTLRVTEQGPPVAATLEPAEPTPCRPPDGGWQRGPLGDTNRVFEYVESRHPDRFRRPWVTYPRGATRDETPMAGATEVLVIEVVRGDVDGARRDLAALYAGNLCVVGRAGAKSLADQRGLHEAVQPELTAIMEDAANGVYASGSEDTVSVEMLMLTPALHGRLTAISADGITAVPWLRPL